MNLLSLHKVGQDEPVKSAQTCPVQYNTVQLTSQYNICTSVSKCLTNSVSVSFRRVTYP